MEIQSIISDLRFGLRSYRKTPVLTGIALLTIALGVGANTTMFSVVNGVILHPLPYLSPDRLVRVWPEKRWSTPMISDVGAGVGFAESFAGVRAEQFTLVGEVEPEELTVEVVSPAYFDVLGATALLGRTLEAGDALAFEGQVTVLSHGLWVRRFGSAPDIIGRAIDLAGYDVERRTVVGVMPATFVGYAEGEAWVPTITDQELAGFTPVYGYDVIAKLREGEGVDRAISQMRSLIPTLTADHPTQFRQARHSPVDVVPLLETIVRDVRPRLMLLLGAVSMVLLIACSNVANLLMARGASRKQEIGLRVALGASRGRIARQVLTESVLLGSLGGAVGVLLALVTLPVLVGQLETLLPRSGFIELDAQVLRYAIGISLLASLLFGSVPALRTAHGSPNRSLGGSGRGSGPGRRERQVSDALVVAEIALSLVLVVGAGLMVKSFARLTAVQPGFESVDVLTVRLVIPSGRYDDLPVREAYFEDVFERVRAVPGVSAVSATNLLPLGKGRLGFPYRVEGQQLPAGTPSQIGWVRFVTPDYFHILGMDVLEGRNLDPGMDLPPSDGDSTFVAAVLVNQTMARMHWADVSPIGAIILGPGDQPFAEVVGVAPDVRQVSLAESPAPEFFFLGTQQGLPYSYLLVKAARGDPTLIQSAVLAAVGESDRGVLVKDVRSLRAVIDESVGNPRLFTSLFGLFAGLALALALIGVYGVMHNAVSQRTREIGVRMSLGASSSSVLATTMLLSMRPIAVGIALGVVTALAVTRLLSSLLYDVTTLDPGVFASVAVLVGASGALASLLPAIRATGLDPVAALRED